MTSQTGSFTASRLTRVVYTPPPPEDIQSLFAVVHKNLNNNETLAIAGGGIGGLFDFRT